RAVPRPGAPPGGGRAVPRPAPAGPRTAATGSPAATPSGAGRGSDGWKRCGTSSANFNRLSRTTAFPRQGKRCRSELHDVGRAVHQRVDVGGAELGAVDLD